MNECLKNICKNIAHRAKQRPYKWGFWCLSVLLFLIPSIIWLSYLAGDYEHIFIRTSLEVGDALGFYGTLLSFAGTVSLGAISIVQNNRASKINQQLREEKHLAQLPIFRISNGSDMKYEMNDTKWKVGSLHGADIGFEVQDESVSGHEIGHITFPLKNVSNFPIHSLKVAKCSLQTIGKTDFRRFEPVFDSQYGLGANETKIISITFISGMYDFAGINKEKLKINVTFECYNPQNYKVYFHTGFIVYDRKIVSFGEDIKSEYAKEATTDDKT